MRFVVFFVMADKSILTNYPIKVTEKVDQVWLCTYFYRILEFYLFANIYGLGVDVLNTKIVT